MKRVNHSVFYHKHPFYGFLSERKDGHNEGREDGEASPDYEGVPVGPESDLEIVVVCPGTGEDEEMGDGAEQAESREKTERRSKMPLRRAFPKQSGFPERKKIRHYAERKNERERH